MTKICGGKKHVFYRINDVCLCLSTFLGCGLLVSFRGDFQVLSVLDEELSEIYINGDKVSQILKARKTQKDRKKNQAMQSKLSEMEKKRKDKTKNTP